MKLSFSTGGVPAFAALPLRILVVGDFGSGVSPSEVRAIDLADFDAATRAMTGTVAVEIPEWNAAVEVEIVSLKSFRADSIARSVAVCAPLLSARGIVSALAAGGIELAAAEERLRACGAPEAIVEMVLLALHSLPAPPPAPERSAGAGDAPSRGILGAIAAIGRSGGAHSQETRTPKASLGASEALRLLDASIGEIVSAVQRSEGLRRLEASWRGLHFLASRAAAAVSREMAAGERGGAGETASPLIIEAVSVPAAELARAMQEVIVPHGEAVRANAPLSLIVAAYELSPGDLTQSELETIAHAAAHLGTPVVAGASFDLARLAEESAGAAETPFAAATGAEVTGAGATRGAEPRWDWNALRCDSAFRWLTLACNPFQLPSAPSSDRSHDARLLWGSPAIALGFLAAQSFARHGWPTRLEGSDGIVEDLPIHPVSPGDAAGSIPLREPLSQERAAALAALGFAPLVARRDHDAAIAYAAPTVWRGTGGAIAKASGASSDDRARATLAYALAENRFAAIVARARSSVASHLSTPDQAQELGRAIRGLLGEKDPSSELAIQGSSAEAGEIEITVRWTPGAAILPSRATIVVSAA